MKTSFLPKAFRASLTEIPFNAKTTSGADETAAATAAASRLTKRNNNNNTLYFSFMCVLKAAPVVTSCFCHNLREADLFRTDRPSTLPVRAWQDGCQRFSQPKYLKRLICKCCTTNFPPCSSCLLGKISVMDFRPVGTAEKRRPARRR